MSIFWGNWKEPRCVGIGGMLSSISRTSPTEKKRSKQDNKSSLISNAFSESDGMLTSEASSIKCGEAKNKKTRLVEKKALPVKPNQSEREVEAKRKKKRPAKVKQSNPKKFKADTHDLFAELFDDDSDSENSENESIHQEIAK
jgi:hypothetical protein